MQNKRYFITGIGTNVGKTFVAAKLCALWQADYWKPIQCGDLDNTDTMKVKQAVQNSKTKIYPEQVKLTEAASPHYAAALEQISIQLKDFVVPDTDNTLLIEGAGGLMVPINMQGDLIIDLIAHLQAEVILVADYYLGSINHTLLSIAALKQRNIPIAGIIFNGKENKASKEIILNNSGISHLMDFPYESPVYSADDLLQKDADMIWHPYAPATDKNGIQEIVSGSGTLLYDSAGNTYIDAISSWWVNIHGHNHPYIKEKITEQLSQLDHVIFGGFTHPKAIELAERLLQLLPGNHKKIFFSDNGSTAVEVALKMALQYHVIKGNKKHKIIAFKNAYHGDTFGAMSVSGRSVFTASFSELLFDVEFIDIPTDITDIQLYSDVFSQQDVAAFIFEPLIQGAGGMQMYAAKELDQLLSLCKQYNILTIADEVMTGFGRTGTLFATEQTTYKADIICVSKGITGGVLPLGVTACNSTIADAFADCIPFYHGHSYTANPIACAAACASLDLFEKENTLDKIAFISNQHHAFVKAMEHKNIIRIQATGTILAIELKTPEASGYTNNIKQQAVDYFKQHGIIIRPLGNVLYVLPPYCIGETELNQIYSCIRSFLKIIEL